jgi:glycosyltransferase involved in cell wall biosynthesis
MLMGADADGRAVLLYNDWHRNILVVGRVAPNKNVEMAIDAVAKCKNTRLIIVGDSAGGYADSVKRKAGHMKNVIFTDKVGIPALKAFYAIADVFLTTSKHEGFCIPAVEAMAMSVPVIANNNCALPYTCGDAAYYANTVDEIVSGIDYVIENKTLFIKKGQDRFRSMYYNSLIESKIASAFI